MSRILSINDYAADSRYGGAEMNAHAVLEELRRLGHDVEDVGMRHAKDNMYSRPAPPDPIRLNHDRILLSNLTTYDPRWLSDLLRIHGDRCVLWIHDAPWCQFRAGSCRGNWRAEHTGCRVALYLPIFKKCKRVLFYTPLQADLADAMFCVPEGRKVILPLFCDRPREFMAAAKNHHRKPGSVLATGRMSPAKGADMLYMFAKRNQGRYNIKAIGRCDEARRKAMEAIGVEMVAHQDHAMMPAEYAQAEYFYHQPPQLDAGPRTVMEARLAGCKLIVSETCGNLSHPAWALDNEALADHCETAVAVTAQEVLR